MVESGWPALEVTQEHLQNLISQGYIAVKELATYHVLEDLASPAPGGIHHVVHGVPSHRFLRLLL
jgi:hypothetical protein